jgi:uncharacterized protein YecT (DUF1311 family)
MTIKVTYKSFGLILSPFVLLAVSPALASNVDTVDCENAMTTLDINHCAAQERDAAIKNMRRYLIASYSQYNDNPELVEAIKASQQTWQAYEDSNCDAVYTSWKSGSIRGLMSLNCSTRITKQRTHELWLNYLTYMDIVKKPKKNYNT